ncbi:unnamed protein product [Plutella xylostella]|uniref:(diamondback moth) hypothetical protein n=1 Tax=Plutella xylostella TaxID=51655 RepID=A0A8S4FPT0_PLUXY|nr:unnamed protein product [Plutella xylostella]
MTCLGSHKGKCRFHFRCSLCKDKHNTILHCDKFPEPASAHQPAPVTLSGYAENNVLLPTARVKIIGRDGTEYHVRALLDSCSQVSFVSSKLVKLLGGKPKSSDLNIIGITNKQSTIKACIPIEIQSLRSPYKTTITCQIVESVTCNLPQNKINLTGIQIPKNVVLADEKFYEPGEINMLISSDVVFQTLLLQTEPIKIELPEQPPSPAQPPSTASGPQSESTSDSTAPAPRRYLSIINTEFGHIVGGNIPCHLAQAASHKVVLKCIRLLNFGTQKKCLKFLARNLQNRNFAKRYFRV